MFLFACPCLLLGIKLLLSFAMVILLQILVFQKRKKRKVCVRERERESWLWILFLFFFFCYADFIKSVRYVHDKGDISIQCHLFKWHKFRLRNRRQKAFSFSLVARVRYKIDTLGGKITLFPSTCINQSWFLGQIFSKFVGVYGVNNFQNFQIKFVPTMQKSAPSHHPPPPP
jgi:hypothetical protein